MIEEKLILVCIVFSFEVNAFLPEQEDQLESF
jgi:hypothetical protein